MPVIALRDSWPYLLRPYANLMSEAGYHTTGIAHSHTFDMYLLREVTYYPVDVGYEINFSCSCYLASDRAFLGVYLKGTDDKATYIYPGKDLSFLDPEYPKLKTFLEALLQSKWEDTYIEWVDAQSHGLKVVDFQPSYSPERMRELAEMVKGTYYPLTSTSFKIECQDFGLLFNYNTYPTVHKSLNPKTGSDYREALKTYRTITETMELFDRIKSDFFGDLE